MTQQILISPFLWEADANKNYITQKKILKREMGKDLNNSQTE